MLHFALELRLLKSPGPIAGASGLSAEGRRYLPRVSANYLRDQQSALTRRRQLFETEGWEFKPLLGSPTISTTYDGPTGLQPANRTLTGRGEPSMDIGHGKGGNCSAKITRASVSHALLRAFCPVLSSNSNSNHSGGSARAFSATQILCTTAKLGVADHPSNGPRSDRRSKICMPSRKLNERIDAQ